mmetsp:Transcript_27116/g.27011  ORF Transcript_27116/g.27011 Transcript_27116/m.27011 type:complete len:178 (-) Transcript_27116:17-550(-)
MFTSPKKKKTKHRRRLVDVEREEQRKKRKRTTLKGADRIQSEKNVDKVKPYDKDKESKDEANTPINREVEESALTQFAHSLLEKLSRKGDGTSTKSNDNYFSNKTGEKDASPDGQKKSCKKKKHKKCQRRKTMRKDLFEDSQNEAEDITVKKSNRPREGSCEMSEAVNTCKSIKTNM